MKNENQNLIKDATPKYHDLGFSVIPVAFRSKKSLVKWEQYQTNRASREQLEQWFKNPEINVGIVTGAASGVVVVDIDTTEKIDRPLPQTVTARTGRGGWHLFYKHPGKHVKTRAGILPHVDIRGDGGIVVMPPSIHENGNRYEWVIPPESPDDFADLPDWVLEAEKSTPVINPNEQNSLNESVPEGQRNDTATRVAGKLLGQLKDEKLWGFAWSGLKEWNQQKCIPPLPESELRATFESVARLEKEKKQKKGQNFEIKAMSLGELLNTEFSSPQWLVERLIPHETVTIVSGAPATYKTWLLLEIALKVAAGEKVFGEFQATQSPVLIIDEENHPRILKDRARLLSGNPDLPIYIASKNGFLLDKRSVQKVIEYSKSKNARVVIFDSFICIHNADENTASEMREVMGHLKEIANAGIAVIVIHHHRKKGKDKSNASQDIRGSSDIPAQIDCHLAVDRKGRDASVTIQQSKLREAQELSPFVVRFHSDGNVGRFEYGGAANERQNKRGELKAAVKKVLEASSEIPNRKELWALVKQSGASGSEATLKTAIKEMVEAGELFTKKGGKNSTFYSLKEFEADDG